jgi:cytochrome b561
MTTYDRTTIRLHWTTAALIVALWIIGQTAGWFPRGPERSVVWSTHYTLGAILIVTYIARVTWRLTSGRRLPGVGPPALVKLAAAGHEIIYLAIGIVLALGIANLFAHGSSLWGVFRVPRIADASLRHNIAGAHALGANLLLILAAAHAAVAIAHQFIWRDGVLTRMWPSLARWAREPVEDQLML